MQRMLSIWLPDWEIERLGRQSPALVPRGKPFALVDRDARGIKVRAFNAVAMQEGVQVGVSLSDARVAVPGLLTHPSEPVADLRALWRLARWCGRYGPNRNALVIRSGAGLALDFGLWIDIAGVEHLFGGENELLSDVKLRLARAGVTARIGLADSYGAAHALARFGIAQDGICVAQAGHARRILEALPVEGLRLDPDTVVLLRRLGLYSIGQLYGLPRTSLARRFRDDRTSRSMSDAVAQAQAVLIRLDQALGLLAEPLRPLGEPPVLSVRKTFPEILITSAGLRLEVEHLLAELCRDLEASALGARRVRVLLTRVDGTVAQVLAGTSAACRTPAHLFRLMSDRLDAIDAGFGIDALVLEALRVEQQAADQGEIEGAMGSARESPALLLDRLTNRSSSIRVFGLSPHASHIPERAEMRDVPRLYNTPKSHGPHEEGKGLWPRSRPPLLLSPPEPIAVLAEVPEGPPGRFTWRRMVHRVVRAEGPERLLPEWWRHIEVRASDEEKSGGASGLSRPRDYYRIEVEGGGRFWVFRNGLYNDEAERRAAELVPARAVRMRRRP